jgi:hypothetical protein
MKHLLLFASALLFTSNIYSQGPAVTSWLQNTIQTGTYYTNGNSTAIGNGILVNCQQVEYSTNYVYITTEGMPSYPTGPFLDGNPSQTQAQGKIYRFPLSPQPNTGNPTSTTPGSIGVFINGVSLYDYRDGVAWNPSSNALCGGPGNPPCPGGMGATMDWNRDAIPAEMEGFDCSKGHPAMGNYHHHQNPSAFDLDLNVVSTICNLYDAEGLYAIDASSHSPLIGFAYDGYPIYGAYGYKNADGSGGVSRIKSSYQLQSFTSRNNGPAISATYFLGYFREDYEYVSHAEEDYLDEHNGRTCVTPDYPNGTYAYFCTVDASHNSAYPYAVGPAFYGVYSNASVNTINEGTTIYTPSTSGMNETEFELLNFDVFPNPSTDLIAVQANGLVKSPIAVKLFSSNGTLVKQTTIQPGQTIAYFDVQTLHQGTYLVKISNGSIQKVFKVIRN